MREKTPRFVVTFHTTTAAIAMEQQCAQQNVAGRLIPVPREITAGCGMAWSAPPQAEQAVVAVATALGEGVADFYTLVI